MHADANKIVSFGQPRFATKYRAECFDKDGNLKWREEGHNLVVTAGLNKLLDATFKTGLASPAWYVGLKDTGSVNAADTLASHSGWAELTSSVYSGNRPAFTAGSISAGAVDNAASKASFTITGADTIYGAMLCDANSGASGVLYGAGDFGSPRAVEIGDTLNIEIDLSVAAA